MLLGDGFGSNGRGLVSVQVVVRNQLRMAKWERVVGVIITNGERNKAMLVSAVNVAMTYRLATRTASPVWLSSAITIGSYVTRL